MLYTVDIGGNAQISWGAKGASRILQNVVNLINTYTYEIAYARTVGISREFIDQPSPQAAAIAANDIKELISLREPRAKVMEVNYLRVTDMGNMRMQVVIDI